MKRITILLLAILLCAWTHGTGGGGLSPTNWTAFTPGGGGNVAGLAVSVQGVRAIRGDVFSAWIQGANGSWVNLGKTGNIPAANWTLFPTTNTSANQVFSGFTGVMDVVPCASSASCMYLYTGSWPLYSGNVSTSTVSNTTFCNTGGWTQTNDNTNSVIGAGDPGQFSDVDPVNPDHVIIGTSSTGIFETFNGTSSWNAGACTGAAATWTAISTSQIPLSNRGGYPGYAVRFDPTSGTVTRSGHTVTKIVYIFSQGTSPGIYKSPDGGATYTLTSSGPTTVQHMKVSVDTTSGHGGGNLWVTDGNHTVWEFSATALSWHQFALTNVTDVAINPLNGLQVAVLTFNNPPSNVAHLYASVNGANTTPTFTEYAATLSNGDTPWAVTAGVGTSPQSLEFDPLNNGVIIASMGQWMWQTTFPSASFVWAAMSAGLSGAPYYNIVVPAQGKMFAGAQDITGCLVNITTPTTPPTLCSPLTQTGTANGLLFASGESVVPGAAPLTFAKIGNDGVSPVPDFSGYSTDGMASSYVPFNLWNTTVTGSAVANNGGHPQYTVASTSLLNTWAVGDAITRNSIVCDINYVPGIGGNAFNCDEITVNSATTFTVNNVTYNGLMSTAGYTHVLYVPANAPDTNFGRSAIINVTSDSGTIQVTGVFFQNSGFQPVCISGVTFTGGHGTNANGCWVTTSGGYQQPSDLGGSVFQPGDVYAGGGTFTTFGQPGGSIAAASATNVTQVNAGSFPLCTDTGGQSWNFIRTSGDAGLAFAATSVGVTNAGATTATLSTTTSFGGGDISVVLTSGRLFFLNGATASGTTLTIPNGVPPGDSIPAGSQFISNAGYQGANTYYLTRQDVARDWVTSNTFYAVNDNVGLIKWTHCGTPTVVIPQSFGAGWLTNAGFNQRFKSVLNQAGHAFFDVGWIGVSNHPVSTSLYRTCGLTGSSATMQRVPGFFEPSAFGFGPPAPGKSYPRIYVNGWYSATDTQNTAQLGIWESTDDPNNGATGTCNLTQTWTNIGTAALGADAFGSPTGSNLGISLLQDIEGDPFYTNSTNIPVYATGPFQPFYAVQP